MLQFRAFNCSWHSLVLCFKLMIQKSSSLLAIKFHPLSSYIHKHASIDSRRLDLQKGDSLFIQATIRICIIFMETNG